MSHRIQHLNHTLPALQITPTMTPSTTTPPARPWPNSAKAAISFTMDNLGEAQWVLQKNHPPTTPIGQDPAVLATLPRMLAALDRAGIKATYFAEAWSLPVYPSAVAELQARGHEVAWHAFQHEVFHALSAEQEADNFAKSWANAAAAGVTYRGFRPPGGDINGARTFAELKERGCSYVSPLGTFGVDKASGVVVLPFEWETVDAFWYMDTPKFRTIRKAHGVREAPAFEPEDFRAYLESKFEAVKREGGYVSILFHPFLTINEERFKVLEETLEKLSRDKDIWVAPCVEVAKWVTEHADEFGSNKS